MTNARDAQHLRQQNTSPATSGDCLRTLLPQILIADPWLTNRRNRTNLRVL